MRHSAVKLLFIELNHGVEFTGHLNASYEPSLKLAIDFV